MHRLQIQAILDRRSFRIVKSRKTLFRTAKLYGSCAVIRANSIYTFAFFNELSQRDFRSTRFSKQGGCYEKDFSVRSRYVSALADRRRVRARAGDEQSRRD